MTVSASNASTSLTGNGSATAFPFTFKALATDEIEVYVDGSLQLSGFTTTLSLSGGTVTFSSAPASGAIVLIQSKPDMGQDIALTNNGAFMPSVIEAGFDRAAVRDIYLDDKITTGLADLEEDLTTTLTVTSATGQSVASRTLLALIDAPVANQIAWLSEAGRAGVFKFDSSSHVAHVTADTQQAIYVAPASDTTGASGAWVRVHTSGHYEAGWFGYKGDGSTVDATANQAILDYLGANGGGRVDYPEGVSQLGTTLQDTLLSNALLVLPKITATENTIHIELVGAPSGWSGDPSRGTIWQTTATAAGNVIGVKTSLGSGISFINLTMRNITIRTPQNSAMSGIDLSYVIGSKIACRVDRPDVQNASGVFTITEPSHAESYGIKCPLNDISANTDLTDSVVVGYYYAYRIGERVRGSFIASGNKWAVLAAAGSHVSDFQLLATNNQNHVKVDGGGRWGKNTAIYPEHNPGAAGPSWINPWGIDFDDPTNVLKGECYYPLHDFSIALVVDGAKSLNIAPIRDETYDFPLLFTGFENVTNSSSTNTLRGLFGGSPWVTLYSEQTDTTGLVGAISFANGDTGASDIRLLQFSAVCDGQTDRGRFKGSIGKDGTLSDFIEVDSNRFVILSNLPNAANDAAAAALTPAVPVGALYRNGSVVMVRVS